MKNELRLQEISVLIYRLFLAFCFYQMARLIFWFTNRDIIEVESITEYFKLAYYGIAFDTTAILYVNALFILLSVLPLWINTQKWYQKILTWVYFILNGIGYVMNFGDAVYYPFSKSRLTITVFQVTENENNLAEIFWVALGEHFLLFISFILLMGLWIFLYSRVKVQMKKPKKPIVYFVSSILILLITTTLVIGGIRGDFKHSTRPINLVDANRHVKNPVQAHIVLNSVFSFFRTIDTNNFKEVNFVDEKFINDNIQPIKQYQNSAPTEKPNVVIFILESFGKEYCGAFNKDNYIPDFESYTPFLDSLSQESLIFTNAYANGRKSIHGMSSVLAGIPSLKDAFTSSPYANQKIQSIVSVCNELGYDTSFFHGAPNGSMGFLGFGNILGFDHYYGKTEYNNDEDFDGIWGIWDEPFFQYYAQEMNKKQTPFMTTLFSVSSHHPFKIPEKYHGKFKKGKGQIHEPIQYTDYALKQFFETAKTMPWYQNTIFVFVADHTNETVYDEYKKQMNKFAIPIIFYSPNPEYQLKGEVKDWAQQIDIYPTLADLLGYDQPMRTWGRSLVSEKEEPTIIVNSDGVLEQFMIGDYIYQFDGNKVIGVFDKEDLGLTKNIIDQQNPAIQKGTNIAKAWYQDYMHRIIQKKLSPK